MNEQTMSSSYVALREARRALKTGNKTEARRQARLAVRLDPQLEEAWLLLAGVSSPRAVRRSVLRIGSTGVDPLSVIWDNLRLVGGVDLVKLGTFLAGIDPVAVTGVPPCGGP